METSRLTQVSAMTLMKVAAVKKVSCAASFRLVLFCEQVDFNITYTGAVLVYSFHSPPEMEATFPKLEKPLSRKTILKN